MVPVSIFQASPFRGLSEESLEALAQRARPIAFRRNERIASLVNPPKRLVLICSGVAKLAMATVNGHERIVYVFRPGDLVGSRIFLTNSAEAAYEVVAITPVHAISIDLAEIQAIGRDNPEILLAVTSTFARRLERITERLMGVMTEDVTVRLCRLLLDFVAEDQERSSGYVPLQHPLTHETMASIVGATRPHTSGILAELEAKGVVKRSRRALLVRPEGLSEILKQSGRSGTIESEVLV